MLVRRSFLRTFLLAVPLLIGGSTWAAEPTLRVMTFNLRYATAADGANSWDKRKEILLETIRQFGPDLLGTQEMLAMQGDYLVENLPGYKLIGVGRDDGKREGEFSAILFKTDRFELGESGTFWLSKTPEKIGSKSWDSSLPRIATWARLRDRSNDGRQLCYLNTHWDHRGNQARVESGKIIRAWLSQHATSAPAIVTGDLNVTDDHPGFRTLVSNEGPAPLLHDVFRQVHPNAGDEEATFHNFGGSRKGRRIDFILATPELAGIEASIDHTNRDGRYPSDHYPVTAVLKVAQATEK